jgi:hypothetical protein
MRPEQLSFRATLVCLAAATAALLAHVFIDYAGDFLLAHDDYDDVSHHSRFICVAIIALIASVCAVRAFLDILDRRRTNRISLMCLAKAALGRLVPFALQVTLLALVLLVGMEFLDCVLAGAPIDGIAGLFGGSLLLGGGSTVAAGVCAGLLVYFLVRMISHYEPVIVAFAQRLLRVTFVVFAPSTRAASATRPIIARGLLLSRRGSKRGPPISIPG